RSSGTPSAPKVEMDIFETSFELVSEGDRNSERLRGGGGKNAEVATLSGASSDLTLTCARVVSYVSGRWGSGAISMSPDRRLGLWIFVAGLTVMLGVGVIP